jgi:hypothetical protein
MVPLADALAQRGATPRCGQAVEELAMGRSAEWLRFEHTIKEPYDVSALPGVTQAEATGLAHEETARMATPEASGGRARRVADTYAAGHDGAAWTDEEAPGTAAWERERCRAQQLATVHHPVGGATSVPIFPTLPPKPAGPTAIVLRNGRLRSCGDPDNVALSLAVGRRKSHFLGERHEWPRVSFFRCLSLQTRCHGMPCLPPPSSRAPRATDATMRAMVPNALRLT